VAAVADLRAVAAGEAVIAEIIVAHAIGTLVAFLTDPVGAFVAIRVAAVTDIRTLIAVFAAAIAYDRAAITDTTAYTEGIQTLETVCAALPTHLIRRAFQAEVSAALAERFGLFAAAAASVIALAALNALVAVLAHGGTVAASFAAGFTGGRAAGAKLAVITPVFHARLAVLAAITAEFIRGALTALFIAALTKLVALLTAVIAAVIALTALRQTVAAVLALVILVVETIAAVAAVPRLVTVCAVTVFTAVLTAAADPRIAYKTAAVLTVSLFFPRIG